MGEDHGWIYRGWDKGGGTTQMSGWIRLQLFWTMLSRCQRLCGAHVADARIHGACRTREPLPYTCVRMVSCQAMRCGNFTVSQVLES
jgi:hypothetical protein